MKEDKFLWIITMILLCVIFVLLILKSYKLYDNEKYVTKIENELNVIEQEIENLQNKVDENVM